MLEMKIPSPGESITEVEIASILVKNGDYVKKDQIIAEIESDKATLELPAEESGVIKLNVNEGDIVKVGDIMCYIDNTVSIRETDQTNEVKDNNKNIKENFIKKSNNDNIIKYNYATGHPSPAAKKILLEKNISLNECKNNIEGTGKNNRITKEDALNYINSMGTQPDIGNREYEIKNLSNLRKKISQRLVSVKNETAMLTTFNEINMNEVNKIRNEYKEIFKNKHGVNLGYMSFFTKAVVRALDLFPEINSMIDGDKQIKFKYKDISIAVSGPKGLMVPVLRNAENLSFRGIEKSIKNMSNKINEGNITIDEMTGGTFTITNGGVFGSMLSTPIINPPQSAILGMHNIVSRPIVHNNCITIAPIMYVALSYDHRIIDGRESVGFLVAIKEAIEDPIEKLMNNNLKLALEL